MKIATLMEAEGRLFVATVDAAGKRYWPLSEVIPGFSGGMRELIDAWEALKPSLSTNGEGRVLGSIKVAAPISPPRNIFCIGKNYHAHAAEFSRSGYDQSTGHDEVVPVFPVVFTKTPQTVIGHLEAIPSHERVTRQLDYEAELAVIIGKGGRCISRDQAFEHVWGYTIVNDVTARDLQKNHNQWFLGKSLDGFCPMGPWVVTADEFNPDDARIQCWVNDELRQDANVNQLIFDIPRLIETISAGITLKSGDVIATGTPAGVGIGFKPPRFLQKGDQVRIHIAGIGTLQNTVAG